MAAIRENYPNPELARSRKREEQEAIHDKIHCLDRMKEELEEEYEQELDAVHKQIAADKPEVIEELLQVIREEEPNYEILYKATKSPLENYHEGVISLPVNERLKAKYPEKYQEAEQEHQSRLGKIESEISELRASLED